MGQNEEQSLRALEHLMEEFFNSSGGNERKHEIEVQLSAFSSQRDAWKLCIYFLNHTSSQYVSMFALSTIECVINREWFRLDWGQRAQLKSALHTYLVKHNAGCPNFLRNKLAKLLVDIARHDWPHFYPEFITVILQFLTSEHDHLLGLVLLRTTSEELFSPRSDLSTQRKAELHQLLTGHIPQLFHLLTALLERLATRHRPPATATPPPSPNAAADSIGDSIGDSIRDSSNNPITASISDAISANSRNHARGVSNQGGCGLEPHGLESVRFRPDSREVVREALGALQHLFTWVDLTKVNTGVLRAVVWWCSKGRAQDDDELCVLAMSTLNELLYRKCAPPGTQNLFIELYHYAVQLLRDVTCAGVERAADTPGIEFIEKLTEFLCLLVEQHLWRLEADSQFSALDFLSLLFQCTFQQPSIDAFLTCLDVWRVFMKQLKRENAFKYSEALLTLAKEVLNKMQFIHNQNQLEDLDNEILDDDNETEWQHFLKECIEIIALVAEMIPLAVFNLVWIPWKASTELYYMIEQAVDVPARQLNIASVEKQRLHCVLRDLSTLTQTLARLSTFFTEHDTHSTTPEGNTYVDLLVTELLKSSVYATRMRFDRLQTVDKQLVADFVEVHAHLLAGLKTWLLWLVLNSKHGGLEPQAHPHVPHTGDLVTVCSSVLLNGAQEPARLTGAAAHLFLCLVNITFPPHLVTFPPVLELLRTATEICYRDQCTLTVVHQSLTSLLIRPWGDLSESDKNQRWMLIKLFFDALTRHFRELESNTPVAEVRHVAVTTLPRLARIVEYCNHQSNAAKKLLHQGMQGTIQHALTLFPHFSDSPEISGAILELFLIVLEVLQQQLGLDFTKMAVQVFLDVAINDERGTGPAGLDKLLQVFQLVVEGPGSAYRAFLPGIISLCLEHVRPLLQQQSPDVCCAFINLLHSILLHRWQYFYTSQVRLGHSPQAAESPTGDPGPGGSSLGEEPVQHGPQLLGMLQVFGQALLQADINVFRLSLAALEQLNHKWKLYHRALFKERLLAEFLTVLLQALLHKSHGLLNDDITVAVYNMAIVDFHMFYNTFLVHFVQRVDSLERNQMDTLRANFSRETDMPTFVQNVQRFVNDMRCYRICNASLPSGSVVL